MMLQAQTLSLTRADNTLLQDVSLTLNAGEFVGLIGPNGAGKSSLLRLLAGLHTPDRGQISLYCDLRWQALNAIPAQTRARHLAYLGQQEAPAWPLAVEHLVGLGRAPWRSPVGPAREEDHAAIDRALAATDLIALRHRSVGTLSGGELQRALLARVFAGEPQVILADEPIAALDPYHQLHMMELLREHAQKGGAVLAALHDLSLAARFCQRLILLDRGRKVAEGEPIEVLTPANLEQVYGIRAHVDCRDDGVVIIPRERVSGH